MDYGRGRRSEGMPMTTALDSIRALREMVEKATPAPWRESLAMYASGNDRRISDNSALIVAAVNALPALLAVAEAAEAVTRVRVAGCLCCNREACDACPPCPPCPACALVDALSALASVKGGGR